MRILQVNSVISAGVFPKSTEWASIRACILDDVQSVVWPPRRKTLTVRSESGKPRKRNEARLIRTAFLKALRYRRRDWMFAQPMDFATYGRPENIDAQFKSLAGTIAVHCEPGTIAAIHRTLNTISLGLLRGVLVAGVLIVPSRNLRLFPPDLSRAWDVLRPCLDLWRSLPCTNGVLEMVVIEERE